MIKAKPGATKLAVISALVELYQKTGMPVNAVSVSRFIGPHLKMPAIQMGMKRYANHGLLKRQRVGQHYEYTPTTRATNYHAYRLSNP